MAAAAAVTQLQAYVARRHDAQEPLVVSIGAIHGGEACNILAERVSLLGTARCFSPALRARLEAELSSLFSAACQALGCRADLDWQPTAGPVINADARLLALGRGAVEKLYGPEGLGLLPPLMCAEDFSYYSARVPTLFAFLGGGNPALGAVHPHHSPHFCIDEAALPRGAALYAQFAWDYLNGSAAP